MVGAGVTGLSIAFHLAAAGHEPVTVYDRTGVGAGASGVQPGGVRQQWGTAANCAMARESLAFYEALPDRLGVDVGARFDRCGYLFVADRPETLAQLRANLAVQQRAGVPSQLLGAAEIEELVPGLRADGVAGAAFCAEDGYFDHPRAVVAAFADAAQARGARIEQADVHALVGDGAGWTLRTSAGDARAERVVVAASTDTRSLVAPLGVELPIVREPRFLLFGEALRERLLEPLVIAVDRALAAKQLADGRLLASDLRAAGDPETQAATWRANVRAGLSGLLPRLAELPLPTLVEGFYDVTPDAQPIVDEVDRGLWVAAGFSGHGFMVAPSVGSLLAAIIAGGALPPWHESLRLSRFVHADDRDTQVI